MSNVENNENENQSEKKKINLKEAVERKLAKQKEDKNLQKQGKFSSDTKSMRSQQTKKPNNQHRRTGV